MVLLFYLLFSNAFIWAACLNAIQSFVAVAVSYLVFVAVLYFFFFFSSRRRHTRSTRDWSSDVCSSDLESRRAGRRGPSLWWRSGSARSGRCTTRCGGRWCSTRTCRSRWGRRSSPCCRSEERRVGKEGGARGWASGEIKRDVM